ncbi:hypothetical protein SCAR479_07612 [Seiridium cardinale]|uniref:Uncharacterized protein n=1 Tax=Seiridium cardinale TaxID=138064 RepID=A0ABR2XQB7_9PEZI
MWDRLRTHKDGGSASHADRRKPNSHQNWQNPPRANSPYGYSFSIKGGPAPPRPPREFDYPTSPSEHPAPTNKPIGQGRLWGVKQTIAHLELDFQHLFMRKREPSTTTVDAIPFLESLSSCGKSGVTGDSLCSNDKVDWMVQRKAPLRPLSLSLLFVAVHMTSLFMVEGALQVTRSKKFSHAGTTTGATGFLQRQRADQD